jgi:hypothetical protein
VTDPPRVDEKSDSADTQREALFQARKRAVLTLGGTIVVAIAAIAYARTCDEIASSDSCKTAKDCDGILGVECLHAPTATYCTHTCDRNEDCDKGFHCESPPWEKNTTRLLCLKDIAPPTK